MEMKQCAFGHFYDASVHARCPYCGERADRAAEPRVMLRQPLEGWSRGGPAEALAPPAEDIADPVVGWLVCVDGPERGRGYSLHDGNNYVGRGAMMDVNLSNGAEKPTVVAYDRANRAFWCGHNGGREIVRLNGTPLLATQALKAGDRIRMGQAELMLVPLCGPDFDWDWASWE